jgi:GrpB-like predicted nucleotidyltransferase (UPF0157 family)/predicted nucleotidyltransferase
MKNDFEEILKEAQEQNDILGLILVGSRGKGFENEYSDYDVVMIVKDEVANVLSEKYKQKSFKDVDLSVQSLSDFKKYADWDSQEIWDRYNYAHCKVLVDKTDSIQKLIEEKGHIPADKLNKFIDYWIDGYVNGVFRSIKCIRNNNFLGAHLEASNSMLDLLTLIFAFNGKHRPFLGYVQKELETYPLQDLPWPPVEFIQKIEQVLANADLKTQQELLVGIEKMSRENGHGHMFDGWEGKDKWAMTFKKNMIKESQKKYLSTLPDGKIIIVKPFDPKVQEIARQIIDLLQKVLPDLKIHFGGASALGIAGQNDIDINIISTPEEYDKYCPIIEKLFGDPKRKGTSIKWEFVKDGFDVELYLTDKNSPNLQDQIKVFDILSRNKELRDEYEQTKLPLGPIDFKNYMRKKYAFFNKILG